MSIKIKIQSAAITKPFSAIAEVAPRYFISFTTSVENMERLKKEGIEGKIKEGEIIFNASSRFKPKISETNNDYDTLVKALQIAAYRQLNQKEIFCEMDMDLIARPVEIEANPYGIKKILLTLDGVIVDGQELLKRVQL